eukprot:6896844-Heterocapsa_arctica.AAC.1
MALRVACPLPPLQCLGRSLWGDCSKCRASAKMRRMLNGMRKTSADAEFRRSVKNNLQYRM